MALNLRPKAVRLYIMVIQDKKPRDSVILVIVNTTKLISTLINEFHVQRGFKKEEQYWVFDDTYCFDSYKIEHVISDEIQYKDGYAGYVYIMTEVERKAIVGYFANQVESFCKLLNFKRYDKPVNPKPLIVADTFDAKKVQDMGWNCSQCTFLNKPYMVYCKTCGMCRPENYVTPEDYCFTQEDAKIIREQRSREEKEKKLDEQQKERELKEKDDNLKKLKALYKEENIAWTTEETDCPVCAETFEAGKAIILRSCHHTICLDCLKDVLINTNDPLVTCPCGDCVGIVEDKEIQGVLGEEGYNTYSELNLRVAEGKAENSFHCKTPNCIAWAVYEDNVNFFKCPICKMENCLMCKAIHENQSCQEYQEELRIKARNDDAARKDLEFLENMIKKGEAMNCPKCKIIIQKKSGCDWMQCNMCKVEICWATKGPRWGPKGKGDNTGGCQCRVKGKCHPACINCH